jgi:hypothetical protein
VIEPDVSCEAAIEVCDGVDNDCDGLVDDGDPDAVGTTYYADADGDGFGAPEYPATACVAPEGYVTGASDCDDLDPAIRPGATEVCDGRDNDCDGVVDPEGSLGGSTWYADSDGDGFGDPNARVEACRQPEGYIADSFDCDDDVATTHPGAEDVCNAADDDCDHAVDEDALDSDHDGIYNCIDGSIWYDSFDDPDLDAWVTVDSGTTVVNWTVASGRLTALGRGGDGWLVGPEIGPVPDWQISVGIQATGTGVAGAGIVVGSDAVDEAWVLRWMGPSDDGGSYGGRGAGAFSWEHCESGGCTWVAVREGDGSYAVSVGTLVELTLAFDGTKLTAFLDGYEVLATSAVAITDLGRVGLWAAPGNGAIAFDALVVRGG